MIISILSFVILIISILYLSEREKYANEKEKLENANMYLYNLEVERPLVAISYFLGQRPVDLINWDEQKFRDELNLLFYNLNSGISNINHSVAPEETLIQLNILQKKIKPIWESIHREKPLDRKTKTEIMEFSEARGRLFCILEKSV